MPHPKRLSGRIALVTGASRGLGRASAVALARAGAHVIIAARTQGALEELDDEIRATGGKATILTLDLRRGERVDQLGPTIYQRWGKLDILVANAGILGPLSPLAHVTADSWSAVLETNLSANWRLVRTLDPLLKLSDAGRVLFVTSSHAKGHIAYWGPYSVSKAALEQLALTYAAEAERLPLRVNLLDPGPMRTGLRAKAYPGEDPKSLPDPKEIAPLVVELTLPTLKANGKTFSYSEWRSRAKNGTSRKPEPAQSRED